MKDAAGFARLPKNKNTIQKGRIQSVMFAALKGTEVVGTIVWIGQEAISHIYPLVSKGSHIQQFV